MDLLSQFKAYIKSENLFQQRDRLLLAVSGGVDSVVLCELCKQAGYDFVIAHCNFQLRGKESDEDEKFVRSFGEKYGVEIFIKRFDTKKYEEENKVGTQVAARELRYSWFRELVSQQEDQPIRCILTAHHANDSIETLLMNFFKGTGMKGLRGILPKDAAIIRPLLFAKKEAIVEFAEQNKLKWREDASNNSNKYSRNYLRNELVPVLKKLYPQVEDNLFDNLQRFRDAHLLYQRSVDTIKKSIVKQKGKEFHIPVLRLLKMDALPTIIYELVKDFGFHPAQVSEVIKLLHSESGKYIVSHEYKILRNRNWLLIIPLTEKKIAHFLVEEKNKSILFDDYQLLIEPHSPPQKIDPDALVAQVDASLIKFPLLLRRWKQGDYFYPLGMQKKKKLSRFFIDKKLSVAAKENVWVLESRKKIVWVVGQRIDDRFKITDRTKASIHFTLRPT